MVMRARGFTLLEVLIAISIFALIGLGAYRLLTTVTSTHDRVRTAVDEFSELGRAMTFIERDLYQVTARPVRDEYGETLPAFMAGGGVYPLEFTRTGWNNPAGLPRSNLQRVAYDVDDEGRLIRYFWRVLDRAEDSEPIDQVLINDIRDFRVRLFNAEGEARDSWSDPGIPPLPTAVEVTLSTEAVGEVRRLFPLVSVPVISNGDANEAGESS